MEDLLVSVIVPIYNAHKYLDKCLQSIINQSYGNLEIILIDDGSTDGSLAISKKYQAMDSRIKIIVQNNMGQNNARKKGILDAQGDVIGFVDSDDWIENTMFEHMVELYFKYSCDLVSMGRIMEYAEGDARAEVDNYAEGIYRNLETDIFPTMIYDEQTRGHGLTVSLWNKLFKREILQNVIQEKDERIFWGEDLCIVLDYCMRAKKVYISHKKEYHYLLHDDSISHTKNELFLVNLYWLYSELERIVRGSQCYFLLMRQIKRYILLLNAIYMQSMFDIDLTALCDWKFHYPEQILESKLVIYGAGSFGQAFYRMLHRQQRDSQIIAWIDKKGKDKERECLHTIYGLDKLKGLSFDYIIIAVQSEDLAHKIIDELNQKYQIELEKIIWRQAEWEIRL